MAIFFLFIACLGLCLFILESFFKFNLPLELALLISAGIILIFLILDIIRTYSKTHVSHAKQLGIIAYFEQEIINSPELTECYNQSLQIIQNARNTSIDSLVRNLNLPALCELEKSVFYHYYKCFYLCPETLSLLYVYKQTHDSSKLVHPFNEKIIANFNPMSEKDEHVLKTYPWLLSFL